MTRDVLTIPAEPAAAPSRDGWRQAATRALLHRIDAWGVALVVCALALVLHDAVNAATLHLAACIGLAYWLGYTVNDYFDAPFDALDPGDGHRNFFTTHPLSRPVAATAFLGLCAVALTGYARFGAAGIVGFAISVSAIWSYSAPPIRLKARPGLDLVAHGFFVQTFPYVLCLALIDASWSAIDYVLVTVNVLASVSGQLAQQLRDASVDRATTVRNFTAVAGTAMASRALRTVTATLLVVVVAGFGLGILPWYLSPLALTFVPALLTRLRGHGRRRPVVVYCCTGLAVLYSAGLALARVATMQ